MHELSFPTLQELEDGRETEMLKRTSYKKVYIWSSRREIRHKTQTMVFYNLLYSQIWDGSISASEYGDNPLDRQEIAGISKQNIFNFPFFIITHYLILIKVSEDKHIFSDSQLSTFFSFVCIWEVMF